MDEKRRRPRWRTSYYFQPGKEYRRRHFDVIDRHSKESIGHLVDLTPEGLRILSRGPIERGTRYDLRIDLPDPVKNRSNIVATAECVWCEQDVNPEFYNVGFRILSINPPYTEVIDLLIQGSS